MATALNGRDQLIPLVQTPLLSAHVWLPVGSDVVDFVNAMQPGKHHDYVGQASRRYLLFGGSLCSEEILQDLAALRFPDTGRNQAGVV